MRKGTYMIKAMIYISVYKEIIKYIVDSKIDQKIVLLGRKSIQMCIMFVLMKLAGKKVKVFYKYNKLSDCFNCDSMDALFSVIVDKDYTSWLRRCTQREYENNVLVAPFF